MSATKAKTIQDYLKQLVGTEQEIGLTLGKLIIATLPEAQGKIWHGGPVWFINDNPVVGFSKLKAGIKLLFWSGADFGEPLLIPGSGKFKDAGIVFTAPSEIDEVAIARWLLKAREIQWDYRNIVKRKGQLIRIQ